MDWQHWRRDVRGIRAPSQLGQPPQHEPPLLDRGDLYVSDMNGI